MYYQLVMLKAYVFFDIVVIHQHSFVNNRFLIFFLIYLIVLFLSFLFGSKSKLYVCLYLV